MMRPWVKVCGITRREDALAAVAAGADAVGFVFVPSSPRAVNVHEAGAIARALPPGVARVGVVASRPAEEVRALVETAALTAVQAHGRESVEECLAYGIPFVRAFPVGEGFLLAELEPWRRFPVLLDGAAPGARGGTGRLADWGKAREAREAGFRVVLAGGLGPGNVRAAVDAVAPLAVDLNSGVERAPGIKDPGRLRDAIGRLEGLDPSDPDTWPWRAPAGDP
jgi:phosphoribosylanthranilate isomerase